jgi:hypothetical protein
MDTRMITKTKLITSGHEIKSYIPNSGKYSYAPNKKFWAVYINVLSFKYFHL